MPALGLRQPGRENGNENEVVDAEHDFKQHESAQPAPCGRLSHPCKIKKHTRSFLRRYGGVPLWFEQTTPYMISRGSVQTGGERGQEAMGAGEGGGVSDTPPTARDRNDGWGSSIPDSRTGAFPAYPRSGRGLRYVSRFSIRCPLPRSTGHQAEARSSRRCANTVQPDAVSLSKETSKYGCQGEERETFGKKSDPQPVSNRPRRTQTRFFRRGGTSTMSYCALPAPPVSSGRPASRAAPSTNRSHAASLRGNMPDQLLRQSFQGKTPPIRWICNRLYLQIKRERRKKYTRNGDFFIDSRWAFY